MDLVVAGHDAAGGIDQVGAVADLLLARHADMDRAQQKPGAGLACAGAGRGQHGVGFFGLGLFQGFGAAGADQAGILRRHDEVGAGVAGKPRLLAHEGHVLGHVVADVGLDQAGFERGRHPPTI